MASKRCGSGQLVSVATIDLASVDIPDKFFGTLLMATARMKEITSTTNNVRRVPRINLDRLYIAHTRSIITTATTVRVYFFLRANYTTHSRLHRKRKIMPNS